MSSPPDEGRREIFASVEAIGRISSRWSDNLKRKEKHLVIAKSLVYGGVVFFALISTIVAYVVSQYDWTYFVVHQDDFAPYFQISIVAGIVTLVGSYLILNKRTESKVRELSDLVNQLKAGKAGHEEAWNALAATKKMLDILPEIARPKSQDALVYGLIGFAIAGIVARATVGILVGLAVFLYFRYEGRKTYETELSRLEEQRRVFEAKMQSFTESL